METQGAALATKAREKEMESSDSQYYLHSKEYFTKTRENFIYRLKETGDLSEDDLKMIEEVWGHVKRI